MAGAGCLRACYKRNVARAITATHTDTSARTLTYALQVARLPSVGEVMDGMLGVAGALFMDNSSRNESQEIGQASGVVQQDSTVPDTHQQAFEDGVHESTCVFSERDGLFEHERRSGGQVLLLF